MANQVIGEMWTGDKTNATLIANYGTDTGAQYLAWKAKVAQALPGVADAVATPPSAAQNLPTIVIGADGTVTVTVFWQAPGESGSHNYVAITRIHD